MNREEFLCQVEMITIDKAKHIAILACPDLNYPDMRKTIAFFSKFDPEVKEIRVFEGGSHDLTYIKDSDSNTWLAKQAMVV